MKFKSQNKVNKKYRKRAVFIVLGFLFFFLTPIVMGQDNTAEGTKIGTGVEAGANTIYLQKATYYEENNLLEVALLSQDKTTSGGKFNVDVVAKNEKNRNYDTKIEQINENYVVLFIQNVPSDFKRVRLTMTDKAKNKNAFDSAVEPLFISQKNSQPDTQFVAKSTSDYQKDYLNGLIGIQETFLDSIDKQIAEYKKQIKQLDQSSSDVTANVELMTGEEKKQAMEKMKQNNTQIDQLNTQIQTKKDEKERYLEKIKLLENAQ
ncbi:hypothetical protein [Enterococcus plantarum]|uniref:hypothetical protein n=1 Tax=Enterococcus plantarum TaxID=1077675 RepID=UPI001A8D2776|nr:hypothetical protein [Enterococcus plantarum]MBO0422712.1 hypothetical protein [Enterococcus plantarum]